MAIQPPISTPFATPSLVRLVLSHVEFANKGYLWGIDGNTYYCFINPNKKQLQLWKKQYIKWAFILWVLAAIVVLVLSGGNIPFALTMLFETTLVPLLIFRHYKRTAENQKAAAVSNGPQMELPKNMNFQTLRNITVAIAAGSVSVGTLIGAKLGTVTLPVIGTMGGALWGALAGAITAVNLVAILLFVLGMLAKPFNSVFGPGFSEVNAPGNGNTAEFGRTGAAFGTYFIRIGNPTGPTPVCGGLTPIVLAGAPASASTVGSVSQIYRDLMSSPRPLVVWSLLPFDAITDQWATEAMNVQASNYNGTEPTAGLVLVVGTKAWSAAHTTTLISHGVGDAAATDGSQSAMLGSTGDIRIDGDSGFIATVSRLASYRDPIQRYGIMMVPD